MSYALVTKWDGPGFCHKILCDDVLPIKCPTGG